MRSSFVMDQPYCQTSAADVNRHARIAGDRVRECIGAQDGPTHPRDRPARRIGVRGVAQAAVAHRDTAPHWEAQPFPFPPQPAIDDVTLGRRRRVGRCPAHHPVKAKLASGIFHVPGGANYARTQADRCYLSAEAAEADGLRPSKN